jgi:hypothetical protein
MDVAPCGGLDRRLVRVEGYELRNAWFNRALVSAGIERASWHPVRGLEENARTIEAVYDYYGRLFARHPYLEWAGMAGMIGPAFYAGFSDLGFVPDAWRRAVIALFGPASRRLAGRVAGDLGFFETTFLTMQKKIFEDQAPMHEAYVADGLPEIERFYGARIIDAATVEAWRQIDTGRRTGDTTLVDRGNRALLFREQLDIIDRFYARMLRHDRPEGEIFTYLLTLAGVPSVPGAHSFPERYPRTFVARLPGAAISVRTPLADGNIALFADRWKLIESDTLPDFLAYIHNHPDEARARVSVPVSLRATRYRLVLQVGRLAAAALTRWKIDVAAAPASPPRLQLRSTKRSLPAEHGYTRIDLTHPPVRGSLGVDADTDSQVWMNARHQPFDVEVALPGGRVYRARAEKAVLLSSARGGAPDRLAVQLPLTGLGATERMIAEYATGWGFPSSAVDTWRAAAQRRASSDRYYSTQVFTPDAVGFVRLEVQVSHHVDEGGFVIVILFSWDSQDTASDHATAPITPAGPHSP